MEKELDGKLRSVSSVYRFAHSRCKGRERVKERRGPAMFVDRQRVHRPQLQLGKFARTAIGKGPVNQLPNLRKETNICPSAWGYKTRQSCRLGGVLNVRLPPDQGRSTLRVEREES